MDLPASNQTWAALTMRRPRRPALYNRDNTSYTDAMLLGTLKRTTTTKTAFGVVEARAR